MKKKRMTILNFNNLPTFIFLQINIMYSIAINFDKNNEMLKKNSISIVNRLNSISHDQKRSACIPTTRIDENRVCLFHVLFFEKTNSYRYPQHLSI